MTRLLLILVTALIATPSMAMECTGINQWIENDKLMEEKVVLQADMDDPATLRMTADLGETHFFIQGNKLSNDYLMMVTLGPDYQRGVTNAATWDKEKGMRLTRVDGENVYKLVCN